MPGRVANTAQSFIFAGVLATVGLLTKYPLKLPKYHMVTIEDLVPENHFLRKVERSLDLSFVYAETSHLYSWRYGRPPIDSVVIVKYLLVSGRLAVTTPPM